MWNHNYFFEIFQTFVKYFAALFDVCEYEVDGFFTISAAIVAASTDEVIDVDE